MTKRLTSPHDKLFKDILTNQEAIESFFEKYLPKKIKNKINLKSLQNQTSEYITEELSKLYTDLVYKTEIEKGEGFLLLHVEHQSNPDKLMPFRVWRYVFEIMERYRRAHGTLPLVYPLIYYSGKQEYNLSTDITDIVDGPRRLVKKILFKKIQLIELNRQGGNFSSNKYLGVMEALLSNHQKSFIECLKRISPLLTKLEKEDQAIIIKIIKYVMNVTENDSTEDIIKTIENSLSDNAVGRVMTLADRLRQEGVLFGKKEGLQEGIQKGLHLGRQEGRQEGLYQTAKKLLNKNFDVNAISDLTSLSVEEINKLKNKY